MKKTLLITSVASVFALTLFFFASSTTSTASLAPGKSELSPLKKEEISKLVNEKTREVFQGPREKAPMPREVKEKEVSAECLNFWSGLRSADLREIFLKDGKRDSLGEKTDCKEVPNALTDVHDRYLTYCKEFSGLDRKTTSKAKWQESSIGCYTTLTVYRAMITDYLTRDQALEKISDPKILADRTIAKFLSDPKAAADTADRLLEFEPTLYPAAKISLYGRMMDARNEALGKSDAETWKKVESALERAKKMAGAEDGNKLREMEMVLEVSRSKDVKAIEQKARKMAQDYPDSGVGHYFLAWAADKNGDRELALKELKKAADAEPSEGKYHATWQIYQRPVPEGAKLGAFGTNFSLPLDSLLPPND